MYSKEGTIFGPLGFVDSHVARALTFNNDGQTPSFGVSPKIGEGFIYHTKTGDDTNILVASAVLKDEEEHSFYLRTFEGSSPTDMGSLPPEEAKRQYALFLEKVGKVVSPEFRVTRKQMRENLERLMWPKESLSL